MVAERIMATSTAVQVHDDFIRFGGSLGAIVVHSLDLTVRKRKSRYENVLV